MLSRVSLPRRHHAGIEVAQGLGKGLGFRA